MEAPIAVAEFWLLPPNQIVSSDANRDCRTQEPVALASVGDAGEDEEHDHSAVNSTVDEVVTFVELSVQVGNPLMLKFITRCSINEDR